MNQKLSRLLLAGFLAVGFATSAVALPQQDVSTQSLFDAAQAGDLEGVKAAIEAGIDVNSKTRYSATALSFAAEKGHLEIVRYLIEQGADPNVKDNFYQATPLTWANIQRHKEVAEYLKQHGAELPVRQADAERAREKPAAAADSEADEPETPDFPPDSESSRWADRKVSRVNWPQFRGTAARGIADGQNPPLHWDAVLDENVRWKTRIEGLGHSCPVIWGDHVYVTTAVSSAGDFSIKPGQYGGVDSVDDVSEHSFRVICLNKNDGSLLWEREATRGVPQVKRHLKSTHANCTVATNGTQVVAFFGGEGLYCYSPSGELLWKMEPGKLDSGWFYDKSYQWGFASSPVIFQDMVVIQCDVQEDSYVAALALADGREIWKTMRDEIPGWSTPTVVDSPRGPMLLTHGTGFARGYNARTGEEWWRFGPYSEIVVPTPFVAHDLIFLASGYSPIQPIAAIELDASGDISLPEGETTGEHVAWYKPKGGPYMPTPLVYGDYLYLCSNSGIITCLQATTGRQVYRERLTSGLDQLDDPPDIGGSTSMVGSPVAADGHIYFPCEEGYVFVVESGPEFKMVAANPIGENLLTTPAISQGVIFVRGQEHLYAFQNSQ
jgi:outer membrane protein assembly factor BamB